jgi:nicotinamide-nucleotide adenylyltransferase
MMIEQAKAMDAELDLHKASKSKSSGDTQETVERQDQEGHTPGGIAVAALNFPTFVGKSVIVHKWLQSHMNMAGQDSAHTDTTLSFLLGSDTLTRLFLPKYYPPSATFPEIGPNMDAQLEYFFETDQSKMVVVRRYVSSEDRDKEQAFVNDDPRCRKWVEHGGLRFVEEDGGDQGVRRGEEMGEISSSVVRKTVGEKGYDGAGNDLCVKGVREYMQVKGLYS